MSMTRGEAIKLLKQYQGYEPMSPDGETLKHSFDLTDETVDTLLTALRPVSREQVEKAWRGEWIIGEPDVLGVPIHCSRCGWGSDHADQRAWMEYKGHIFCGHCGAPMTDEAVEMVIRRWEELYNA